MHSGQFQARVAEFRDEDLEKLQRATEALNGIILGKTLQVRLSVACLLARGHLLIEDIPGVGKTTLAHGLASILGLSFNRIQFTSDLLPADITGVSIWERDRQQFRFHPGPVFSQLVLADEINRATPKTQSALLEAMEERQVTADGETHRLPDPFYVVATQNPTFQVGTFPLPESQLDRFLMRLSLGYPGADLERELLAGGDRRATLNDMQPVASPDVLQRVQKTVDAVHVAEPILDYVQALLAYTRESLEFEAGLSPRAGLSLLAAARSWALLANRRSVLPEDVQAVFPAVAGHRLRRRDAQQGEDGERAVTQVLERVELS